MRGDTELRNLKGKRSLQVLATSDKNPVCEFYFTDVNNDLEYKDPKLFPIRTQRQFSFTIQYVIVLSGSNQLCLITSSPGDHLSRRDVASRLKVSLFHTRTIKRNGPWTFEAHITTTSLGATLGVPLPHNARGPDVRFDDCAGKQNCVSPRMDEKRSVSLSFSPFQCKLRWRGGEGGREAHNFLSVSLATPQKRSTPRAIYSLLLSHLYSPNYYRHVQEHSILQHQQHQLDGQS